MTSKERLLRALALEKPDRLPVTIHQWQKYHLDRYMGGMDALAAFKSVNLDASIQYFGERDENWNPIARRHIFQTPQWREDLDIQNTAPGEITIHHTVTTPEGVLTYKTGLNDMTTWIIEYIIKKHDDVALIDKYMPVPKLNRAHLAAEYDRIGDAGILRGLPWGDQGGPWQHACCLFPAEELIMEALENPDWVHGLLQALLKKKLHYIDESMRGAKYDLVETGGGSGSDTLISPKLHEEFCLPYDRQIHAALREAGQKSTYHTCGGMMFILNLLVQNGADASETLSPPGVGGNIAEPEKVRAVFGGRRAMIGGMDQFNILGTGTPAQIRAETFRLFEGYGKNGGYICSACDHFFEASPENLRHFAAAGSECVY
jgi:uroporphyrinogen-III decarboxylase